MHNETSSKFTMEHTFYSTDLGEWPTNMNNETKEHWIRKGSSTCQHNSGVPGGCVGVRTHPLRMFSALF